MARFVIMKKGGGGKVAINTERVTHVRSATGAFTDVFFDGQQIAVEGTFEEVVRILSTPERRIVPDPVSDSDPGQRGLVLGPAARPA